MDELRGRAGRGEGRGDLARHMARLAHARHDQPPFDRRDQIERMG
jgi:hypothetical protein